MTDLTVYVLKPKSIGLMPGEYSLSDLFDITTETVSVTASSPPTYLYTTVLILPSQGGAVLEADVNPVDGTVDVNIDPTRPSDPNNVLNVKVDVSEDVTASTPFYATAVVEIFKQIEWFQSQVTFANFFVPVPPYITAIHFENVGVFGSQNPVIEGQDAVFTVSLSYDPSTTVTVQYTTTDGSAHAGTDYVAKSGVLTFNPGQSLSQTVDVKTLVDPNAPPDANFYFSVTDASGATILPQYKAQSATLTSSLFTPGDDSIDFTNLTPDQVALINLGSSLYQTLGGNDTVVLPSILDPSTGRYVMAGSDGSAPSVAWDPTQTFIVGAASDTTANEDKILEGAGAYNLSIVGSATVGVAFDGIDTSSSSISLGSGENDILQIGTGKTLITGGSPTTLLYVESDGHFGVNLNSVTADEIDIYNTPAATVTGQVLTNSLFVEFDQSTFHQSTGAYGGSGLETDPVKGGNLIVRDSITLSNGVIGTGAGGSVDVGGGQSAPANTIHVEASGRIVGSGSIVNFQGISLGSDGLPQIVDGPVIDDGLIEASGGTLAVEGNVTGAGKLQIDANSTLVLFDSDSTNISFAGANGTLAVFGTSMPTGVISGFGFGDVIDLKTVPYSIADSVLFTPTSDVLDVIANGVSYALDVISQNTGFLLSNDGSGGTDVTSEIVASIKSNGPVSANPAPLAVAPVTFTVHLSAPVPQGGSVTLDLDPNDWQDPSAQVPVDSQYGQDWYLKPTNNDAETGYTFSAGAPNAVITFLPGQPQDKTITVYTEPSSLVEPIQRQFSVALSVDPNNQTPVQIQQDAGSDLATVKYTVQHDSKLNISSSFLQGTPYEQLIQQDLQAALDSISKAIPGGYHENVNVKIIAAASSNDLPLASAGPVLTASGEPSTLYNYQLGQGDSGPDIILALSPDDFPPLGVGDRIYSGNTDFNGLFGSYDAVTIFTHELMHGFGFGDGPPWNNRVSQDTDGAWFYSYASTPGQVVALATPNKVGDIPGHVADPSDLMAPSYSGRNFISETDSKVLQDLGYTDKVDEGYLSGATVFADANGTGLLATNDPSTTTDTTGSFSLTGVSGLLIAFGGTDTSTGLSFKGQLSAPAGSSDITPLTTLLADLV
jgi:hypothetical protein